MKKIIISMAMTLTLLALTACGNSGDASNSTSSSNSDSSNNSSSTESSEFKFITAMSNDVRTEILNGITAELQEKYPSVEFLNDSGGEYNQKIKMAYSSGDGYDMVFTDDLGLTPLIENDYLLDIGSYIDERGWVDKQLEGATEFYNQRYPDKRYTVGANMAPVIVYYNKDIFNELGLEIPKTIEEYENILKTATEAGYIGAENAKENVDGWYIQSMVQNFAPFDDVVNWYYLNESTPEIGEAFKKSAEVVKKWADAGYFRKDYIGIDYGDVPALFSQGQTAMSLDGNWFLANYEESGLNIGVFPFPGVEDASQKIRIINPVDAAFGINKEVNETDLNVALDFIDKMIDQERCNQWLKIGTLPAAKYDTEAVEISPLTKEMIDSIADVEMGYYLDNVKPGFLDVLIKETQLYMAGEKAVDEYWNALDTEWNNQ